MQIDYHLLFWIPMPLNGVVESSLGERGDKDGYIFVINYNEYAESERHITTTRNKSKNLFYKNEMTFKFDKFSKKLKATFETMEKYI